MFFKDTYIIYTSSEKIYRNVYKHHIFFKYVRNFMTLDVDDKTF